MEMFIEQAEIERRRANWLRVELEEKRRQAK
jgi:hypothetical protein